MLITHHVDLCLPTARYLVHLSKRQVTQTMEDPSENDPKALTIAADAGKEDVGAEDRATTRFPRLRRDRSRLVGCTEQR